MSEQREVLARAWIRKARNDLFTARKTLASPDAPTDTPMHADGGGWGKEGWSPVSVIRPGKRRPSVGEVARSGDRATTERTHTAVQVEVEGTVTLRAVLDALELKYPVLCGAIRDHVTRERRSLVRFFACGEDWSHESPDAPLPEPIATGKEVLLIVGAIAGG